MNQSQELTEMRKEIVMLREAVQSLVQQAGVRLTRTDVSRRLGICRQTLTERVRVGSFPAPGTDGKWLLSDLIEFERGVQ
jgi:hypothetical protein